MRSAGNFSPEWGYLAPAPSLARTARVVLVATAIGATAGAGVVLSLVERPAEAQKTPIAARAIVTSVRETAVPSVAPTVSTAAVSSPATARSAAPVPASAPVAASTPPPAAKSDASARTAARAMPQAQPQAVAAPPSTVVTATPPLVALASATPAPSAPATTLSASNSAPAPAPATAATTANANVSVAAASSSATTAAVGSSVAPQAADAAPVSVPESPGIIAPETPPKKAKRHASSKAAPAPGLGSILRRLFVAHSGRSYYPHSANGGL